MKALMIADLSIDSTDQVVGDWIDFTGWVQLVANRTFGVDCQRLKAVKLQRRLALERMEVAPNTVEFSGHTDDIFIEIASVTGGSLEIGVRP